VYIKKANEVDILIIGEGTYPYIKGGVSTWIHQLIAGLPEFKFGVIFLGSRPEHYGDIGYELPSNLAYLEVYYLFDRLEKPRKPHIRAKGNVADYLKRLHDWFRFSDNREIPTEAKRLDFYLGKVKREFFLYHEYSWELIKEYYINFCPDEPFVDYFWTIRNMHLPIWKVAEVAKDAISARVIHSPSTGYAGFLGALIHHDRGIPFILTEHGIYTRERKIDLMMADWIRDKKLQIQKSLGEIEYLKQVWIKFFMGIGRMCYEAADPIISLFYAARKVQIEYGAPEEKTLVIPNGVDVKRLSRLREKRPSTIPKVIALIGRVVPIKDIKTFIKAMRIVVNQLPDAEGWIVGPEDEDQKYANECHKLVAVLGLTQNIKFLGFQNVTDVLPQIGLLTLTSISEGMPLVVLEGFAAGVPTVTTDAGACRQLIYGGIDEKDKKIGKAGEVTPLANPEALAKAYLRFLTDEEEWKKAQQAAMERVERYYTLDGFLNQYREIYTEAMKKNGRYRL